MTWMSAILEHLQRHLVTTEEYLRMGEAGVFVHAGAGIAECWVMDVAGRAVHVFRDPSPGGYRARFTVSDATASVHALCGVAVTLADLFPA